MKKLRVLVVEDNDESRQLYVLVLTRAGFEVKEAVGGEEALQILDECDPDILITDLRTPSMSGIDLIRRIRSEERWANLPIIAISHTVMNNSPTRPSKARRAYCASRSSLTGCCPPSSS